MSKVLVLVDWKVKDDYFITNWFKNKGHSAVTMGVQNFNLKDRIRKFRYPLMIMKYLQLASKGTRHASNEDTIICVSFTLGFCCTVLRSFRMKKTRIICLNIIAHKNESFFGRLRKVLYSYFLNKPNIFISVNSLELVPEYNMDFGIKSDNVFFLPDRVSSTHERRQFEEKQSYVFCGGEAKRDWRSLFIACEHLQDIRFVCVARRITFDHNLVIPSNVEMYFDIPEQQFFSLLKGATLQVIPLVSQRPCGLIVMLRGALLSIPIVATNTPSIRNYIKHNYTGLLVEPSNVFDLMSQIKTLFYNPALQREFSRSLLEVIVDEYGENSYMQKLEAIVDLK